MFGMVVFGELYPAIGDFHISGAMGRYLVSDWLNISLGLMGLIAILMAVFMFWGGEFLEKKFSTKEVSK